MFVENFKPFKQKIIEFMKESLNVVSLNVLQYMRLCSAYIIT